MNIPRRTLFGRSFRAGSCGALCSLLGRLSRADAGQAESERPFLIMHPVGQVEREGESVHLRILDQYRDALLGLEGDSHIFVLYWCDRRYPNARLADRRETCLIPPLASFLGRREEFTRVRSA
jgi:hypothetical protein